jgi:electron-transferring-flavoprotein dehydrogenase
MAMKSGMLAAETIYDALIANSYDEAQLKGYRERVLASYIEKELFEVRNFHQAFENGRMLGLVESGIQYLTGGRGIRGDLHAEAGHLRMQKLVDIYGWSPTDVTDIPEPRPVKYDNKLTFDKVTDVYRSGTEHDEDQPPHLKILDPNICIERCTKEYGNPCQFFCPAAVYEVEIVRGGRLPRNLTSQTAFTAKPATSWTRTRSSTG